MKHHIPSGFVNEDEHCGMFGVSTKAFHHWAVGDCIEVTVPQKNKQVVHNKLPNI